MNDMMFVVTYDESGTSAELRADDSVRRSYLGY